MSKALINAVALALPLAAVYYWFGVREPVTDQVAPQSQAPAISKHSKSAERACLRRTTDQGVELEFRADCELTDGNLAGDTLGQVTEDRQGRRVVTGYDL
jgi:hypothetical protein